MNAIERPTGRPKLRTKQAAEYCGSTESTFNKLRVSGNGPIYISLGRVVVYDPDDLDAWLASRRRRSTSDVVEAAHVS